MHVVVFGLILLSAMSGANAIRFASKEAERAYYASLESSDASFSLKQANISAFLSAGAYCHRDDYSTMKFKGPAEGFQIFHTIFDSKTDTQGFVGVLDSDKSIYVAYRGSSTISNWIVNIDAVKTDYTSFPDCNCQVHKGWYQAEQKVIQDVIEVVEGLRASYPSYAVKVTGHSLGAALAQLTSMDLAKAGIKSTVLNFGQPRTGDYTYSQFVPSKVASTWRVVHDKDTVPHLPPPPAWTSSTFAPRSLKISPDSTLLAAPPIAKTLPAAISLIPARMTLMSTAITWEASRFATVTAPYCRFAALSATPIDWLGININML